MAPKRSAFEFVNVTFPATRQSKANKTDNAPIDPKPILTPPSPTQKSNRVFKWRSTAVPSGKPAASAAKRKASIYRYVQQVPEVQDNREQLEESGESGELGGFEELERSQGEAKDGGVGIGGEDSEFEEEFEEEEDDEDQVSDINETEEKLSEDEEEEFANALEAEVESDLVASGDISDINEKEPDQKSKEKAAKRQEVFREGIEDIGLPPNVFDPDSGIEWDEFLLEMSSASASTKSQLRKHFLRIKNGYFPQSPIDVCAWMEDKERQGWHNHDDRASLLWEEFFAELLELIDQGEPVDFDPSTMTKMSGCLGAVIHFAWHFPSFNAAQTQFAHVLDPSNPSLACQAKKIGTPPTVSTSDMIPIRATAKKPD